MNRDEILALLSQADPRVAEAVLSGKIPLEEFLRQAAPNQENFVGFDITRIRITDGKYFDHSKIEIIEDNGQLGTLRTESVWDCGHSQKNYGLGGIDSFGHVVCEACIRFCDRGKHLCCVNESKVLSNGLVVCDYHSGIWRFFKSKFEKARVR